MTPGFKPFTEKHLYDPFSHGAHNPRALDYRGFFFSNLRFLSQVFILWASFCFVQGLFACFFFLFFCRQCKSAERHNEQE